jgi:hypothetical protein
MKVIKPDGGLYLRSHSRVPNPAPLPRVFLAGSIEMGKAIDWQTEVTTALVKYEGTILNPRRDDWDSSWEQSIKNKKFKTQVNWELNAIEDSNMVAMYLQPGTMSPISLLELGILSDKYSGLEVREVIDGELSITHPPKLVAVCCPEGFWRKGNVDIVCYRNSIKVVTTIPKMIAQIKKRLKEY